jgi:hypothetical protein
VTDTVTGQSSLHETSARQTIIVRLPSFDGSVDQLSSFWLLLTE